MTSWCSASNDASLIARSRVCFGCGCRHRSKKQTSTARRLADVRHRDFPGRCHLVTTCESVSSWVRGAVLSQRWSSPLGKAELIRYANNFVVLAYYQGKRLQLWIVEMLETRFGLATNHDKTKLVRLPQGKSFDVLDFTMRYECSVWSGCDRYLHVGPSHKAMGRIQNRLRELTATVFLPSPLER